MLAACSTTAIPIKTPILCPSENRCGQISVNIRTNQDLAQALHKSLYQTDLCVIENQALKKCIADFNQRSKQ